MARRRPITTKKGEANEAVETTKESLSSLSKKNGAVLVADSFVIICLTV